MLLTKTKLLVQCTSHCKHFNHCSFKHSHRARDIGVWFDVMRGMVFVGILTNCAILGFTSEQLMQWLPSLFTRDSDDGDQLMALGSGR